MDFWMFMDAYGYYLTIGLFLFSLIIQFWLRAVFSKYSKVMVRSDMTGKDAAELILHRYSLGSSLGDKQVLVESVSGSLTDHYSPKEKKVRLSEATYASRSVAAIGVAAHECGHAIQDSKGFFPNRIRALIAPIAGIGSRFGPILAIIGLFILDSGFGQSLFTVGIAFFAVATLFYIVTLPVELDASRRAVIALRDERLLTEDEVSGAKKVLTAAAMTYIAAAATSILQLLRLLAARRRR